MASNPLLRRARSRPRDADQIARSLQFGHSTDGPSQAARCCLCFLWDISSGKNIAMEHGTWLISRWSRWFTRYTAIRYTYIFIRDCDIPYVKLLVPSSPFIYGIVLTGDMVICYWGFGWKLEISGQSRISLWERSFQRSAARAHVRWRWADSVLAVLAVVPRRSEIEKPSPTVGGFFLGLPHQYPTIRSTDSRLIYNEDQWC